MSDRHLFDLAPDWALGYDEKQWIVLKVRQKNGVVSWRSVSFIASNKRVLARVLDELGVPVTDLGQQSLDQLPARFRDWKPAGMDK
jgi:hypothetical protein